MHRTLYWDWVKPISSPHEERATAVASDPRTGEVYMAGDWRSDLAGPLPVGIAEANDVSVTFGGFDGVVVKMDPMGNAQWAFKVGGDGDDRINDIHVDESGHFYICGTLANGMASFAGTALPDGTTEFFNPGAGKAFLARYDPDGKPQWVRFAGGLDVSEARSIATNNQGSIPDRFPPGNSFIWCFASLNSHGWRRHFHHPLYI